MYSEVFIDILNSNTLGRNLLYDSDFISFDLDENENTIIDQLFSQSSIYYEAIVPYIAYIVRKLRKKYFVFNAWKPLKIFPVACNPHTQVLFCSGIMVD